MEKNFKHKQKRREENLISIESAKAFLERVGNDEDFRKELEGKTSVEERIKFAKAQGFDFTKGEVRECMESLSDEQLDAIAAGGWKETAEVAGLFAGVGEVGAIVASEVGLTANICFFGIKNLG